MKDFMYAAVDKDTWREVAIAQGVAHVETDGTGMMTLVYNEGFHADHIGEIPPDTRFHVNLRVLGDDVEREFIRSKRYRPKTETGVDWIDPETVTTPYAVWLGGMDYFAEDLPDVAPVNTSPPVLSHLTAGPGNMVSVMTAGVWLGNPDLITYQWMRDGSPINQAITINHTVRLADVGHTLTCVETAKNEAGQASATSNECVVPGGAQATVKAPAAKNAPAKKASHQPTGKETKSMRKIKRPEPKLPAKKVSAKKTYRAKKK